MTSRATLETSADQLARFLRAVDDCIGAMLSAGENLDRIVTSMTAKYDIVEAKRPDKGVAVLRNSLQHTYVAPHRDEARIFARALEHRLRVNGEGEDHPPLDKREFYDDRVRKAALG